MRRYSYANFGTFLCATRYTFVSKLNYKILFIVTNSQKVIIQRIFTFLDTSSMNFTAWRKTKPKVKTIHYSRFQSKYFFIKVHIMCSECPPLAETHAFRCLSLIALLIVVCGMSSQIWCSAFLASTWSWALGEVCKKLGALHHTHISQVGWGLANVVVDISQQLLLSQILGQATSAFEACYCKIYTTINFRDTKVGAL